MRLKTVEERRAALEKVPPEYLEIVKTHVKNTLSVAWHWRDRAKNDPKCLIPVRIQQLLRDLDIAI